jgi:hypothetical protein
MVNEDVARVVAQAMGNMRLVELEEYVRGLKAHITEQGVFIGEILQATGQTRNSRLSVPATQGNCNFCYHAVPGRRGGMCPCGAVGYCSKECQALDWTRHHRRVCVARENRPERVRSSSIPEDCGNESHMEWVD